MGKLFGLLGHPVSHSMSPTMHNDAFTALELPYFYQAFDVAPNDLERAVVGIRTLQFSGFNVTIPHKVAIMDLIDEVDPEAAMIGAVNTVVNVNNKLIGYNTDGEGYLQSLLDVTGVSLKEKDVLVIGAGGAARAVVTVLARYGVHSITIANRTTEKAEIIARECHQGMNVAVTSVKSAEQNLGNYSLIINTTSVGMSPNTDDLPIELTHLQENSVVSDLIYNPLKTRLLTEAEKKGATIVNGVGMFVGQGALAFQKWTGKSPDRNRMKQIVMKHLGG